jgi:hypothetical protein
MGYRYYYDLVANKSPSVGTRTNALVYPGAVCPTACSFGRVHGPSPATGSVTFKGSVLLPVAQPVKMQIGQSVFYGFAVKGTIDNSIVTGNQTTFNLVDMRDRLHDENHAAQYNMIDPTGTWWHLMPQDWDLQIPTYISQLEMMEDFTGEQTLPNYNLNLLQRCPPTFSLMTLMKFFAILYNFTFSWSRSAGQTMMTYYPENLDFGNPTKVIECIDTMLQRCNLQFTAWGDLQLHITDKGRPDNPFEESLLSGNVNLCNLPYKEANIGAELNTKGRRIAVVGGRNKYENWFPCYPDWNRNWTFNLINPFSYDLSALLIKNKLTDINLVEDLPQKFWDCRKYNGKSRMKMTIADYVKNIPYKAYRADFDTPLCQDLEDKGTEDGVKLDQEPECENFRQLIKKTPKGPYLFKKFKYVDNTADKGTNQQNGVGAGFTDSLYPPSQSLVSDSNRQFLVKGTVREDYIKGEKDDKAFFLNGVFTYIMDGVNMEIDEYIVPPRPDPSRRGKFLEARRALLSKNKDKCKNVPPNEAAACIKHYKVTLYFDKHRWLGQNPCGSTSPPNKGEAYNCDNYSGSKPSDDTIYEWLPDHIYLMLSLDREMYTFFFGAAKSAARSREQVVTYSELKRSYVCFKEVPMITRNIVEQKFISVVFADEIANEIAFRKLSHEYITTAGFINMRTVAGFMPSGVIESVQVGFSAASGLTESINFTNTNSDERIPSFQPRIVGKTDVKTSEILKREIAVENARRAIAAINREKQAAAIKGKRDDSSMLAVAQRFGGEQNAANIKIDPSEMDSDSISVGEILVVGPSTN